MKLNDIRKYSTVIDFVDDDGDEYYMAYHPEFGKSACSAVGDTPEEALGALGGVTEDVAAYYMESEHLTLPEPGVPYKVEVNLVGRGEKFVDSFLDLVEEIMLEKDINREELAESMGCDQMRVDRITGRTHAPYASEMIDIAFLLGIRFVLKVETN